LTTSEHAKPPTLSRHKPDIARYNALTFSLEPDLSDRLAVWPQYVMPKRALTVLAGRMAGASLGKLTHWFINRFVARYQVDMSQAAEADTDIRQLQ
jgi:hypothetical protein